MCLNCIFYDSSAHNQCLENQAEWVREKDKGNFCGYFAPHNKEKEDKKAHIENQQKLKDLFSEHDSSDMETTQNPLDELNNLFKKDKDK